MRKSKDEPLKKSCSTGWVITNYGVPLLATLRRTRKECISDYCGDTQPWPVPYLDCRKVDLVVPTGGADD